MTFRRKSTHSMPPTTNFHARKSISRSKSNSSTHSRPRAAPNGSYNGSQGEISSYFPLQPLPTQHPVLLSPNTPMSQARHLETLFTERSYLLNALQQQNFKATDLLRRIPSTQENLDPKGLPRVQRKVRKQLGWLKHRLDETNRQERAILTRLGQLTDEIQSIERWSQVENERQLQSFGNPFPGCQGVETAVLSPMSPDFQPQEWKLTPPQWTPVEWPQPQFPVGFGDPSLQIASEEYPSELPSKGRNEEDSISPKDTEVFKVGEVVATISKRRPPFVTRSSSLNSATLDVLSTSSTLSSPEPVKRRSIPTLPGHSIWAPTVEESKEAGMVIKGNENTCCDTNCL